MGPNPNESRQGALGTGMARNAANAMMSRPYRMHVEEAKAMGQAPMTPEQFAAQNRGA